ncbi:peptidylprolyl isomerase [Roseibium sp. MMSF_3544]|uniref:peptidylprolyl isomerase n=1 Tax=unclassified Roseibium TaxID=2629323 RepID=UPI00273F605B|nr:peptidylprolyl isomerase [Roseibium sp. MMSF_3544]
MLDALRKGAGTWVAKLFIALLIFSFAIWGVTDFLTGFGQNTAAKVGDTEVSLLDFDRTYRQDLNNLSQQLGRVFTREEGNQLGIPQQALGRLIAEAALNNTATDMQLSLSDQRLAEIIQSDPAFRGLNGRYDRSRLDQILRANGYQEDEYVVQRRQVAERSQLVEGIAGNLRAPNTYLEVLAAYQNETRSADYLLITADTIGDIEDPDANALNAYYEENKAEFRAPEYREIKLLQLTSETLARPEDVVEADARAEYELRADDYFQTERRKVRQMSFPSQEAAEEAAAELAGGKTFDDLMGERNLSDNDVTLGVMAKADFLDETLGDAAFSLAAGTSSGAVEGRFSTVILNVEEVLPEATRPFEEVKDEIVENLAREQAEREILDLLDEIEDARAGGALLDEVSERFSLEIETPQAFDQTGKSETGSDVTLPDADGLVAGTFDSDVGIENDVIQLGDQGFIWYEVAKVIPTRERALDEVRDDVVTAWKADELTRRLDETAASFLERMNNGTPLLALAAEGELEVQTAEGLVRNTPSGNLGQDAISEVFNGPVGTNAATGSADGSGRIVLKVTDASVPAFDSADPSMAQLATQLSQQMRDSLVGQFITDRENQAGVVINQAGVAQIIGLTQH